MRLLSHINKQLLYTTMVSSMLILTGCASNTVGRSSAPAPTIQYNNRGVPSHYRVVRGDTVSRIALKYGLNYRDIGRINRLNSAYTIYPNQWLKLWEGGNNRGYNQRPTPVVQRPVYTTPPVRQPSPSRAKFQMPSTNRVVKEYDASRSIIGMWFEGQIGDPVYATTGGTVLYSGNGVQDYGNLIIIQHADNLVSAYAHNSQLLVQVGDSVSQGQKIALMGNTGATNQAALEFQIRKGGDVMNPRELVGY